MSSIPRELDRRSRSPLKFAEAIEKIVLFVTNVNNCVAYDVDVLNIYIFLIKQIFKIVEMHKKTFWILLLICFNLIGMYL